MTVYGCRVVTIHAPFLESPKYKFIIALCTAIRWPPTVDCT